MKSVGTYEVLGTLARGGMAQLELARARGAHGFEKVVVLKRIHPHLADDPGFVEMFLDEARLAAQLNHPNVVQVFDIGEGDDGVFFTMEYLRGADLRELLKAERGAVPLEFAMTIAVGVAAGLHHAHRKVGLDGRPLAVIHRDVSPTNVIVTYEGAVKIVDFGIAKAAPNRHLSRQSTIKGKVAYMSPEQCEGGRLDARSDVFSLGAVLYELTTGLKPYRGDTEFALMNEIVNSDVRRPGARVDEYPEALERIVLKAMARDASQRYGSAGEMRTALEGFAAEQGFKLSAADLGDYAARLVPLRELDVETDPVEPSVTPETAATVSRPAPVVRPPNRRPLWIAGGFAAAVAIVFTINAASDASSGESQGGTPEDLVVEDTPPAVAAPPAAAPPPAPPPEAPRDPPREVDPIPASPVAEPPEPAKASRRTPPRGPKGKKRGKKTTDKPAKPVNGDEWVPIRRGAE